MANNVDLKTAITNETENNLPEDSDDQQIRYKNGKRVYSKKGLIGYFLFIFSITYLILYSLFLCFESSMLTMHRGYYAGELYVLLSGIVVLLLGAWGYGTWKRYRKTINQYIHKNTVTFFAILSAILIFGGGIVSVPITKYYGPGGDIDNISVLDQNGDYIDMIICDEQMPDGTYTVSEFKLTIRVHDSNGDRLDDAKVEIQGLGVNDRGTTNSRGEISFTISPVLPGSGASGEVTIMVSHRGHYGYDRRSIEILVFS